MKVELKQLFAKRMQILENSPERQLAEVDAAIAEVQAQEAAEAERKHRAAVDKAEATRQQAEARVLATLDALSQALVELESTERAEATLGVLTPVRKGAIDFALRRTLKRTLAWRKTREELRALHDPEQTRAARIASIRADLSQARRQARALSRREDENASLAWRERIAEYERILAVLEGREAPEPEPMTAAEAEMHEAAQQALIGHGA